MLDNFVLYTAPKKTLTVAFEILNAAGMRANSSSTPVVEKIYAQDFSLVGGYPKNMIQVGVGLYSFDFVTVAGPSALGTYIVDLSWSNPDTNLMNQTAIQVICRLQSLGGSYLITVR